MATKLESKNANDSSAEEHNSLTTLNNRASLTQGIDVPSPVDDDDTILVLVYFVNRQSSQSKSFQVVAKVIRRQVHIDDGETA